MNVFRSFITKYKIVITTVAVLITVGAGYYLFQTKTEAEQDITDPLTPVTTGIEDVETVNSTHETTHEQTTDYQWNTNTTTTINLEGSTITSQSSGVMISGTTATISEDGSYMLSGLLDDGQIVVDTTYEDKGTIKLILNDAQITNTTTSPIYVKNAGKVIIILVDGTTNTINDSRSTTADDVEDGLTAAIYSKSDLSIGGNGSLVVNGSYKDGITSKDGLIIENTNIDVKASDDGIVGKDYLVLTNTKITADVSGDGLKSSNETDAGRGYITITDSNLNIDSGSDAVQAATDITIDGGVYDFTTASGSNYLTASSKSAKGLKAATNIVIDSGSFTINSADDSIHANETITINDGEFTLSSGDDGIHADEQLTINNGTINVTKSFEGLESMIISINDGEIHVNASDDGINIASGNDDSGSNQFPGMPNRQDMFAVLDNAYLIINGGYVYVNAYGDGVDTNGSLTMTDGTLIIDGPSGDMNGAIDYNGNFNISGGLLVATGSSGMAQAPSATSTQKSVMINLTAAQSANSMISLLDNTGDAVVSVQPTKTYQSLVVSSPKLQNGTYTVNIGGSNSGSIKDGVITDGSYSGGNQNTSFTISSTTTTVGNTGGMMQNGGGMMPPGRGR